MSPSTVLTTTAGMDWVTEWEFSSVPPTLGRRHLPNEVARPCHYEHLMPMVSRQEIRQVISLMETGSYEGEVREVTNLYGIRNLQVTIIS